MESLRTLQQVYSNEREIERERERERKFIFSGNCRAAVFVIRARRDWLIIAI